MKLFSILFLLLIFFTGNIFGQFTSNGGNTVTTDKVGIGTTNPLNKLDVNGNISLSNNGSNVFRVLQNVAAAGYTGPGFYSQTDIGYGAVGKHIWVGTPNGNTEIMRLDNLGHLGIGTQNPVGLLSLTNQIQGDSFNNGEPMTYSFANTGQSILNSYYLSKVVAGASYSRYFDIACAGAPNGSAGGGIIRFLTNDYYTNSAAIERMRITSRGWVSIGTPDAAAALTVASPESAATLISLQSGNSGRWAIGPNAGARSSSDTFGIFSYTYNNNVDHQYNPLFEISAITGNIMLNPGPAAGNVLIGKVGQQNPNYKLDVAGAVRANQITVNTTGADYVFKKDYNLPELSEVQSYISKNHHLSAIPSAVQMKNNGVNLGELNIKLLQKVEELTLYIIANDKKDKIAENRIKRLEAELLKLKQNNFYNPKQFAKN